MNGTSRSGTMEISVPSNFNILKLPYALYLIVACGEALISRPETITNTTTGEDVMFPIEHQGKDEQYIVNFRLKYPWNIKILTWHSNDPGKLHFVHSLYEQRVTIKHGSVVLNDVQVNDSGEYQMRIDYYGSKLKNHDQSTFGIQVFNPVSKPMAKTFIHAQKASNITLSCLVSNEKRSTIYWEKISLSGSVIETYVQTILVIGCATEEEQHKYRCIVKNPVSNASSNELSVNQCNVGNWNGKRNHLMILVPLAMMVTLVLYLKLLCKRGSK